jgi:uncharacterized protein YoaH (UPF0181 family)
VDKSVVSKGSRPLTLGTNQKQCSMLKLKVTYKGQPFNNIRSAIEKAAMEGVVKMIRNKIQPLESEIISSGGTVEIVANGLDDMHVNVSGMPEALKSLILSALK